MMQCFDRRTRGLALASLLASLLAGAVPVLAATPAATYQFNNTLAADEAGKPALTSVDPLGMNQFETDTVFGSSRRVFHWQGNAIPTTEQAGLSLDTTGLVTANNYSVELDAELLQRDGAWRRLIDVQNRQSDAGFYVDPSNHLDVFPVGAGTTAWTNNTYHDVVLTDASSNTVKGYLDGNLEFTLSTNVMDINNAGNLMNFFLDNTVGGGQGEYSDGRVALIRLYDTVLTDSEVQALARDPFHAGGVPPVPEPGSLALLATGGLPLLTFRRRAKAVVSG